MKRGTPDHPKVASLAQLLNIPIYSAVGLLELLWHFTARYAPQGDIGKHSDKAIAKALYWQKRPGRTVIPAEFIPNSGRITTELWLISSLIRAEFMDISPKYRLVVHDWSDHADEAVRKFLSRHSLDFVQTESSLPLPLPVPEPLPDGRPDTDTTFEQAMERVPIQLREQVKPDFARMVFDSWDGREGKDAAGINVKFEKHLRKRWNQEGEQWSNGCHSGQKKISKSENTNPTNYIQ